MDEEEGIKGKPNQLKQTTTNTLTSSDNAAFIPTVLMNQAAVMHLSGDLQVLPRDEIWDWFD